MEDSESRLNGICFYRRSELPSADFLTFVGLCAMPLALSDVVLAKLPVGSKLLA